jgi:leucyl-tRNA synthetase
MLVKAQEQLAGTPGWNEIVRGFLLLLAPYAPHLAEELWARRGEPGSVHEQPWPAWDPALVTEDTVEIPVQVNGKVRDKIVVPSGADQATLESLALASPRIQALLAQEAPRRVIVVPGRLVNIVV